MNPDSHCRVKIYFYYIYSSKGRIEEVKRNKKNNYKSHQEEDRNREYDYVPARKQRKNDLQKQINDAIKNSASQNASKLPKIPRKKRDDPGPSSRKDY